MIRLACAYFGCLGYFLVVTLLVGAVIGLSASQLFFATLLLLVGILFDVGVSRVILRLAFDHHLRKEAAAYDWEQRWSSSYPREQVAFEVMTRREFPKHIQLHNFDVTGIKRPYIKAPRGYFGQSKKASILPMPT